VFALIAGWQQISDQWDRWLSWARSDAGGAAGVSNDTEFFCPMCPGVTSTWPEKCPICKMPLVRRTRGEATVLPDGVIARMQLSPYRVQLAGIRSSEVAYRTLYRTTRLLGRVTARVDTRELESIAAPTATATSESSATLTKASFDAARNVFLLHATIATIDFGQLRAGVSVIVDPHDSTANDSVRSAQGIVRSLEPLADSTGQGVATIELTAPAGSLVPGQFLVLLAHRSLAELEPYRSQPRGSFTLAENEPRRVFHSDRSPQQMFLKGGKSPFLDGQLVERRLRDNERLLWWTPADTGASFASSPGLSASSLPGLREDLAQRFPEQLLVPTVLAYAPDNQVLAVPDSSIVETTDGTIVFLETMPGMYDAASVEVGSRCEGYRPVIRGLEAGQRVVTRGAFLLDAETRLNPMLAASYFGSGSREGSNASTETLSSAAPAGNDNEAKLEHLKQLSDAERALAKWQRICPVTRAPLGSMGELVRIEYQGRILFLCCEACAGDIPDGKLVPYQAADSETSADPASVP
ncbi:MAG: hypothetical protein RIS70_2197, partial [Planctomycetota bacterium]|jgi:hypothetical protein